MRTLYLAAAALFSLGPHLWWLFSSETRMGVSFVPRSELEAIRGGGTGYSTACCDTDHGDCLGWDVRHALCESVKHPTTLLCTSHPNCNACTPSRPDQECEDAWPWVWMQCYYDPVVPCNSAQPRMICDDYESLACSCQVKTGTVACGAAAVCNASGRSSLCPWW